MGNEKDLLTRGNATLSRQEVLGALQQFAAKEVVVGSTEKLQVAFCCDTTGSMHPFFVRVREAVSSIAERLGREQVLAAFTLYAYKNHGDEEAHFDGKYPFAWSPLSTNPTKVISSICKVRNGGGGDGLCAMEDVFHHLVGVMGTWHSAARRVVIVIGDMPPHGVIDGVGRCPHEYDYRSTIARLRANGAVVYSVHCYEPDAVISTRSTRIQAFYQWLARTTGGRYLPLDDVDILVDLILGVCMKETGRLDTFLADAIKKKVLSPKAVQMLRALQSPDEK